MDIPCVVQRGPDHTVHLIPCETGGSVLWTSPLSVPSHVYRVGQGRTVLCTSHEYHSEGPDPTLRPIPCVPIWDRVGLSYVHPMCTTVRAQIPLSVPSHVSHVGQSRTVLWTSYVGQCGNGSMDIHNEGPAGCTCIIYN